MSELHALNCNDECYRVLVLNNCFQRYQIHNTDHPTQHTHPTTVGCNCNYNTECDKFMLSNPGRRITTYSLGGLFGAAYVRTAMMQKAVTGFQSTGIWPINPDIFTYADFLPSTVTEEPQPAEHVFAYCY